MCVLKSRLLPHIQYFQSDDTGNTVSTVLKCVYRYTGGDNVRDYIIFVYFILMLNFIRASRNQQIVPGISQFFYCIIARYQICLISVAFAGFFNGGVQ